MQQQCNEMGSFVEALHSELQNFRQSSAKEIDEKEQQLVHIQSDLDNFTGGNSNLEAQLGELIVLLDAENSLIKEILSDQSKKTFWRGRCKYILLCSITLCSY